MAVLIRPSIPFSNAGGRPRRPRPPRHHSLAPAVAFLCFFLALPLEADNEPSLVAQGIVMPVEEATLGAKVAGIIEKFNVEEGQGVARGDILVELDHSLEELDVQQRDTIREAARLAAEKSRRDYENNKKLWDQRAISEDEYRKFELQAQIDARQFDQAEILLRMARERLEQKFIRAPFDGIVVRKLKNRGEPVDELEKIIKIVNVSRLHLVVYLDAPQFSRIRIGQPVQVECATLGRQTATGIVSVMDPIVDAASGQFRVKILIENPDNQIKAGIPGTATFLAAPGDQPARH